MGDDVKTHLYIRIKNIVSPKSFLSNFWGCFLYKRYTIVFLYLQKGDAMKKFRHSLEKNIQYNNYRIDL